MTARNAFVKTNMHNGALVWLEREQGQANETKGESEQDGIRDDATAGLTGEWAVVPEQLELADGPRYIDSGMTATVRDGQLHIDTHPENQVHLTISIRRHEATGK